MQEIRNAPDNQCQGDSADQGRLREPFALRMSETVACIPNDMADAAEEVMEKSPSKTEQDQFPGNRIEAICCGCEGAGAGGCRNQKPREQKRAEVEGRASDAMCNRHHHGQHRTVDLQMRRQWSAIFQAASTELDLGHEPLPHSSEP